MPELDGYGVLYMLSKHDTTAHIPSIFLTAQSERGDIRKAMEMGADDYLTKPFDDIQLLNAMESRLRKRSKFSANEHWMNGSHGVSLKLNEDEQIYLLQDLVKEARVNSLRKKQHIYEAGDTPLFVFYLLKGKTRSFLLYQDGRELSTG